MSFNLFPNHISGLTAGRCNLNCKYCYISKDPEKTKFYHDAIVDKIKSGEYLNQLDKVIGLINLKSFSHWGTEPTLTLSLFKNFYKTILEQTSATANDPFFISIPTNFLLNEEILIHFLKNIPIEHRNKVNIEIQCSLDGPKEFTDENRNIGSTKKIVDNFLNFVKIINMDRDLVSNRFNKLSIHFKSTTSKTQFKYLIDPQNCYNFYKFFDEVLQKAIEYNTNNLIYISRVVSPTKISPEDITKEDGKNLALFFNTYLIVKNEKPFNNIIPSFTLYNMFCKCYENIAFSLNHGMQFKCSAGNSNWGIDQDGMLVPCHRYFFSNYKTNNNSEKNMNYCKFNKNDNTLQNAYIAHKQYRGYNDFWKFQFGALTALAIELVDCGLISRCYKNEHWRNILIQFCVNGFSCPAENYIATSSTQIKNISDLIAYGNGLIEEFIIYHKNSNE